MKIIIKYLIYQGINNSKLSFTLFIYSSPILYTLALNLQTHLNFCLIFYAHLSPLNSVLFLLQALRSSNLSINNLYGYFNSYILSHALSLSQPSDNCLDPLRIPSARVSRSEHSLHLRISLLFCITVVFFVFSFHTLYVICCCCRCLHTYPYPYPYPLSCRQLFMCVHAHVQTASSSAAAV